jgi:hypothetical protein
MTKMTASFPEKHDMKKFFFLKWNYFFKFFFHDVVNIVTFRCQKFYGDLIAIN